MMKHIRQIFFSFCVCLVLPNTVFAQFSMNGKTPVYDKTTNTYLVSIPQDCFGKDYTANITLCNDSAWSQLCIEGQTAADNTFTFQNVEANKKYSVSAVKGGSTISANITFTYLPLLHLAGDFGYSFSQGYMTLCEPEATSSADTIYIKAKWRGGSTNSDDRHKRNYKINTLTAEGKSKDYSFLGMRKDNNWILDAGQVDMFRLRNRTATELWNDFATKPYYSSSEPKAQSGVNGKVIEVILNNEYRGIYSLTEAMDRKELKLKKHDDTNNIFHGQLWKASGYGNATFWNNPGEYDNTQENWDVFETKYPEIDDVCPTDYSVLWQAVNFVVNSDDNTFCSEVADYFDLPVLVDYFIFLKAVNAIDNIGKNMYWAVYDKATDKKLTPAIWDLDATIGQNYVDEPLHPDMVAPTYNLPVVNGCNIYYRLYTLNANSFRQTVADRYQELRKNYLSLESLQNRYQEYYDLLAGCGATEREENKWSKDTDIAGLNLNFKEEIEYIRLWLAQHLDYLDGEMQDIANGITSVNIDKKDNNCMYNVMGQKVSTTFGNGVYILNGKKFIKR